MINLNKFIFSGLFIILIIFLFHTHIKEGFVRDNNDIKESFISDTNPINKVVLNNFSDLQRKRNQGSPAKMNNLLNNVLAHVKNEHLKHTSELLTEHSLLTTSDNPEGTINISQEHPSQYKKLEHINYLDKYINVVEKAIEHNKSNQTQTKTLLTNIFG